VDLDSGRALHPGQPGELWVRGPRVMQGEDSECSTAMQCIMVQYAITKACFSYFHVNRSQCLKAYLVAPPHFFFFFFPHNFLLPWIRQAT